jgi:flagellar basal body-associated protein FliL
MANRFQKFVENIIYAGMKPEARSSEGAPAAKPRLFARFLSGPAPSDPLYLTNQTFGQKARRILLMVTPLVVVIAAVLGAVAIFSPKTDKGPKQLTVAEIKAKVLPGFNKEIKLDSNQDLEVTEVHFEHAGGSLMVGNLRNKTSHRIVQAVVVFELADASRSELGGVTVTEINLDPGVVRTFKKPIEQANAVYALVREVDTR